MSEEQVEKILRANTWWRIKTKLEEELLGKKQSSFIEANWEKNND